jgi:hypothetical protein
MVRTVDLFACPDARARPVPAAADEKLAHVPRLSIVVLPFANLSGDPQCVPSTSSLRFQPFIDWVQSSPFANEGPTRFPEAAFTPDAAA